MRVNRYLETDITSAYANQKQYDKHRHQIQKIQTQTRNPFKNTSKDLSWSPMRGTSSINDSSLTMK